MAPYRLSSSSPENSFMVPSASIALAEITLSINPPYSKLPRPAPPWASHPPTVEAGLLVGNTRRDRLFLLSRFSTSCHTAPAWIVADSPFSSISVTLSRSDMSTTIPPFVGRTPPYPEVAAPLGTSGTFLALANFTSSTSSSSFSGFTTAAGIVLPSMGLTSLGRLATSWEYILRSSRSKFTRSLNIALSISCSAGLNSRIAFICWIPLFFMNFN